MSSSFGVTLEGFKKKRLENIKSEIEIVLRGIFGNGLNTLPTELVGQYDGALSEIMAYIWEAVEGVYNSQYPDSASGVALDLVASITGIERLEATKGTGEVTLYGDLGTLVEAGTIFSVDGVPTSTFELIADATIAAGTDAVQTISFSSVPNAGAWTLLYDGEETGSLAFNSNAAAVEAALNALTSLEDVTVSGNYTSGFTVTFGGVDGQQVQSLLQTGSNTLNLSSVQTLVTFLTTIPGVEPNVTANVQAVNAGQIPAYSGTLTVIDTPVAGLSEVINLLDIDMGKDIETDAELRTRRADTLSTAGSATLNAIRSRLLEIDEVETVRVFENDSMVIDGGSRPPKSFEALVVGGDDQEIFDTIWLVKPAGIATFGNQTGTIVDSQGVSRTIYFSRPTSVPIWLEVDVTTNDDFPIDGEEAIKQAIVDFADQNFGIGDDVIVTKLYCPINNVGGVVDITIRIGLSISPTTDNNISILDTEISDFDTSRIEVNSI
jgi:uncharacterized phage protein gp47/JayE